MKQHKNELYTITKQDLSEGSKVSSTSESQHNINCINKKQITSSQ